MAGSDEKPPVRWRRDSGVPTVGVFYPPQVCRVGAGARATDRADG